jgi:hypothetical protein
VKRKLNVKKKAFLAKQVSAILQNNNALKYKNLGCPTISCFIGEHKIKRVLVDLGASVNLLPYSVFQSFNLGELKPTSATCPTISCFIGEHKIKRVLLDLGVSVNLLPYSVFQSFNLGELKPTSATLLLADRSVQVSRGIVEDVLVQVDKFIYHVDFVFLDTQPVERCNSILVI